MQTSPFFRLLPLAVLVAALVAFPAAFAQDDGLPDEIVVEREGLFPEGIEWDAQRGRFLLGSLSEGTIFEVQDDGSITPLIENDRLMASVGIHIDAANDRLLVGNNNPAVFAGPVEEGPIATLMAFDLETGEELFYADLSDLYEGDRHFANDVTVDAEGNAYVTNSFAPVIFQVDPEGNASIFLEDERFAGEGFNLNGLDYHPDGYLLVAKANTGQLFKVPVDSPQDVTEVELDRPINGADGVVLRDDGTLFAVVSPQSVVALQSDDDWQTASVVAESELAQPATTIALRDGEVYAIFAKLGEMGSDDPPDTFEIVHAPFDELAAGSEAGMEGTTATKAAPDAMDETMDAAATEAPAG